MNKESITPACVKDTEKDKCVRPNGYIETLKACKYDKIPKEKCLKYYQDNREKLRRNACDLFHSNKNKEILKNRTVKVIEDVAVDPRIHMFNNISSSLGKISKQQCLNPKNMDIDVKEIDIKKKFGTKSAYGLAFLANVNYYDKKDTDQEMVAVKIMPYNSKNLTELKILDKTNDIILDGKTIHFPILYKTLECPVKFKTRVNEEFLPELLKKQEYFMVINELAKGDLKMFLNDKTRVQNTDLMRNTISQIYLSIAMFHQMIGMNHLDAHWGNFLYHEVNPGGVFHYKIGGKDVYIPNMGYMWVIWDFGFAKDIENNNLLFKDYIRISHAFLPTSRSGWLPNNRGIDPDFVEEVLDMVIPMLDKTIKMSDLNVIRSMLKNINPNVKKTKNLQIVNEGKPMVISKD